MILRRHFPLYRLGISLMAVGMGLTACSSDDDVEVPSLDKGAVKTQMAIAVPQGGRSGRMTAQMVQENKIFRGMSDIWLVSLQTKEPTPSINGTLSKLGTIGTSGTDGFDEEAQHVKVYKDIKINSGTDKMLFYGTATPGNATSFEVGLLNSNLKEDIADLNTIEFSLQPCMTAAHDQFSAFQNDQKTLIAGLNAMLTAATAWNAPESTSLQKAYYQKMCSLKAGSGRMVRLALQEIYRAILEAKADFGTASEVDAVLAGIASDARTALFTYKSSSQQLEWKPAHSSLEEFPRPYGLPEGGVQLEVTPASQYQYAADSWIGEEGTPPTPTDRINLKNICYPPALTYFVESPVCVSSQPKDKEWGILWENNWIDASWKQGAVDGTTRAVALKDQVQYGTALLKTAFKCSKALLDHRADYPVDVSKGLKVTGILVGGQPQTAGWNLLPKDGTAMDQVVYDQQMLGPGYEITAPLNSYSDFNYTLVMPNAHNTEKNVPVAVEFRNTTNQNIYGAAEGIIPPGGTFYLITTLELPNALPTQSEHTAIFESDHFTTAKFSISSLRNAYVTIPDLRSVKLEVGMYVDIEWGKYEYGDEELGV